MFNNYTISIENADGSITGVYGYGAGEVSNVGEILVERYNTPEKVRELINNGHIRKLARTIEDTKFFDKGYDIIMDQAEDMDEYLDLFGQDYNYFFFEGRWIWDKDEVENTLNESAKVK